MLNFNMLDVTNNLFRQIVVMLSAIMLNVVMLSVVAPFNDRLCEHLLKVGRTSMPF